MSRFQARTASFLASLALAIAAARGQDNPAAPAQAGLVQPVTGPVLTLEQCVAEAIAKNFSVRIQFFAVGQAKDSVVIAHSAYDPTLGVTWQKTVTQSPLATSSTNTAAAGAAPYSDAQSTNLSLNQPVVTGGTVSANYTLSRNATNSIQSLLNPAYDGQIGLNVTQPLLQGAGTDFGRANIRISEWGEKIARENFRSAVLTMVYNVESQYFSVIYARRQYAVALDTLKLAKELLDENTVKRRTGVLTDLDVVQAQAGVATAESQLIGYKQAMQNAEDNLLQTMGETQFKNPVGPVEFPRLAGTDVSFDLSYKLARDNGPNLAVIQDTIEQYKLDALIAKRNALPLLNATAGLGHSAYEHSYTDANGQVWNSTGYNWNAGLQLSLPWGLRNSKALYRQAMRNIESEKATFDQADQTIVVQVRAAVRSVQSNVEAVSAATAAEVLSQKQYDLQKAKFDAGLATSYDVLQAQNQLETSQISEIQAEVNLRVSLADLRFLEGSSLPIYHISLN